MGKLRQSVSISTRNQHPQTLHTLTNLNRKVETICIHLSNLSKCCRSPALAKDIAAGHQQSSDAQQSLTGFNTKRKRSPVHPLLLPKVPGKALKRRGDLKIIFTSNFLIRELRGNIALHCFTPSQTNSTKTSRSLPS